MIGISSLHEGEDKVRGAVAPLKHPRCGFGFQRRGGSVGFEGDFYPTKTLFLTPRKISDFSGNPICGEPVLAPSN